MTDFKELVISRRSHRRFETEEISGSDVEMILNAALLSPSSKNRRDWHFVVVDDKMLLEKLSDAKEQGGHFLKDAPLAVVVMGNPMVNDCWIEDCSIASMSMQWQAEELGLGSCWIQIRGRGLNDGTTADEVVKGVLNIPDNYSVLSIIAIGHKVKELHQHDLDDLKWENVHINSFE